jgi:hypothetical protein
MATSLKTDVLSALPEATSLQDTDLIPVGAGAGATLKKMTAADLRKALFTFSRTGYVLLEATTVNVTAPSTAAGKSTGAVTATFAKNANADLLVPIHRTSGWLTCTGISISGNTLTTYFLNTTTGTHSGTSTFLILQFKKITA